jgi:hypothetical protein
MSPSTGHSGSCELLQHRLKSGSLSGHMQAANPDDGRPHVAGALHMPSRLTVGHAGGDVSHVIGTIIILPSTLASSS